MKNFPKANICRDLRHKFFQKHAITARRVFMQKAREDLNIEFRIRLQEEFTRRVRINERYSIRAFAKYLSIDSSTLSQILSAKRSLSEKKMKQICEKIGISSPVSQVTTEFNAISIDTFTVISDWYHFAILDLTLLGSFKPDAQWIARKLSIQEYEAKAAFERLQRLNLLVKKNGRFVKGKEFYTNYTEGTTAAALKEYQRQVIKKALHAVDNCDQQRKDITSITIAADSKKLKQAKEKIKKFRRELCAFLESGDRDAVFHLTLQLYPVTNIEN